MFERNTIQIHPIAVVLVLGVILGLIGGYVWYRDIGEQPRVDAPARTATATLQPITPIPVTTSLAFSDDVQATQVGQSPPPTAVADATTSTEDGVRLRVAPEAAAPGSVVAISGAGFEASEVVELSIAGDGAAPVTVLAGTDEAGAFQATYQVPPESPLGYYRLEARGKESDQQATTRFLAAEGPTPTPIVIRIETALATTTPQSADADATPVPLYRVVDTRGGVDCGWYGFFGTVSNPDGSPRADVSIRVYHETETQTVITGRSETDDGGYWEVSLGDAPASELAGLWHLVIIEDERRGSSEIAVELDTRCDAGRPTKFKVDWQRSFQ